MDIYYVFNIVFKVILSDRRKFGKSLCYYEVYFVVREINLYKN